MSNKNERVKFLTFQFPTELGNIEVDIRPITREKIEALGKQHRKPVKNKQHKTEYEINEDTYYPDLYARIVREYRGLTQDVYKLLTYQEINGKDTSLVPYSNEKVVEMARTSNDFASFIEDVAIHFDTYLGLQVQAKRKLEEEQLEEELPNS